MPEEDLMEVTPEMLRHAMRHWTSGVTVVTSRFGDQQHGMTVNSFTSLSLDPPVVTVSLAIGTRTQNLVEQSRVFGVTILHEGQAEISDRFAGRMTADGDRFDGLETFVLTSGVPLLQDGLVSLDCRVVNTYQSGNSVLYIGEVIAIRQTGEGAPLVYHNRLYHKLGE